MEGSDADEVIGPMDPVSPDSRRLLASSLHISASEVANPVFEVLYPDEKVILDALNGLDLLCTTGLARVFATSEHAKIESVASFAARDIVDGLKVWGVYDVILEKDKCPTLFYVGSGSGAPLAGTRVGLDSQLQEYSRVLSAMELPTSDPAYLATTQWRVSSNMRKALTEGYKITARQVLFTNQYPKSKTNPDIDLWCQGSRRSPHIC